jgi:hypothetical protein
VNRIRRYDDRHDQKRRGECRQLNVAPEIIAVLPFLQVLANRADIVAEKAEKNVPPWTFRFAVVPMAVDGQPIDSITLFILSIRIPFVVLHVDAVVHRLRKTARDRLRNSKEPVHQF